MKHNISVFQDCANCGACYNICPTKAIAINSGLFYQVVVDETKCVECGKCMDVCPVNEPRAVQNIAAAYSAVHKNAQVVKCSSSGGAFTAVAEEILRIGGVVWGACYDDSCKRVVFRSTDEVDLDDLRRSKYTESLVGDSFKRIKEALRQGRYVLFCGTPCQVAGLKRFTGDNWENLYTCDFSCGGLASNQMYQEWLCELERQYGSLSRSVNFRPKDLGWATYSVAVEFENGKRYAKPAYLDPYFASFVYRGLNKRDYCLNCRFSDSHYADLILADFWKYRNFPGYKPNTKGLSLVLVNSQKGAELLKRCEAELDLIQLDLSKASYNIRPTKTEETKVVARKSFLDAVQTDGFCNAAKKHCLPAPLDAVKFLAKQYIKKAIGCYK